MDIQKEQFPREIMGIIKHVADSHFIAFDLEFSGVAGRRKVPPGGKRDKLTLQELYDDVKEAAEKYQILQVGLTIVKEDQDRGCYVLRPYNFNINPVPTLRERYLGRVWAYHSGAVSFLHDNGFRFDLPITNGVPYLSRKEEVEARTNMRQMDAVNAALPNMPFKNEDLPLLTHIREVVTKWQSEPKDQQDEYLEIPCEPNDPAVPQTLDRYQIRLTHQTVRNEFPGLKTHGMGHFVQVTNPTDAQLESQQSILDRRHECEISRAIGFRWLMEAIMGGDISNMPDEYFAAEGNVDGKSSTTPSELKKQLPRLQEKLRTRRKVAVGHNCFTDLVNLYKCFIGDLPEKLEDFQENVHTLFPAIIDTKHIASFGGKAYGDTSLGNVYQNTNVEPLPKIEVDFTFDRYDYVESYHEAGYDSLQTAKVLIKLSAQMERENKLREEKSQTDPSGPGFGVAEDYVTAPESQSDGTPRPTSLVPNLSKAITSPVVTAMQNLLLSNSVSGQRKSTGIYPNQAEAGSDGSSTESSSETTSSVVAVKQTKLSSHSSASAEIKKVNSKFSSSSIYDVLNADKADSDDDTKSDLLQWSNDEETKKKRKKKDKRRLKKIAHQEQIEKMVAKGELMPRWDGGKGFWRFFGNKLQVNGTVENVCHLP